jgi:glycosyltransferase involved in cell wall biosynthesis
VGTLDSASNAFMQPLPVLSVNCFVMGHAPYQLGLERCFGDPCYGIRFDSVHLPEANRKDLLGRIAYKLLTLRLGQIGSSDWDYFRLRSEVATSFFLRRLLKRTLPLETPAVLHLHTQSIALLSADLIRSTPTVISLDCTTALLAKLHPQPASRTYQPTIGLERRCLAAAGHIVCWSDVVRRSVIGDYGIAPERVSVIRPSVKRGPLPQRRTKDVTDRKLRLLFVGNDFERKGGHDLLEVFAAQLHVSCELDVVSNGVAQLEPRPGLRLHRGLSSNSTELLQLYADADLLVMPTYEDAFGLVFIEAMAAGLPCIGTRVLAVPELVQHEVTGLTVEAGERSQLRAAIERLRDDAELRSNLSRAALEFVRQECDEVTNGYRLAAVFRSVGDSSQVE